MLAVRSRLFLDDGIISLVACIIPGWLALIAAAAFYARSKGYEWYYGALGLLGVVGLIILLRLPDKVRNPVP
jgi:chromate transport protein ChrA